MTDPVIDPETDPEPIDVPEDGVSGDQVPDVPDDEAPPMSTPASEDQHP